MSYTSELAAYTAESQAQSDLAAAVATLQSKLTVVQADLPALTPVPRRAGVMGVNSWVDHANPNPVLDAIAGMGFKWIRPTAQEWSWVEGTKGSPNWSNWQAITDACHAHGLKVVACALGTPAWANDAGVNGHYGPNSANVVNFANYAKGLIDHGGDALEVWNEPNWQDFYLPAPDPAAYANLLVWTANIVHPAYPSLPIMSGGLSPSGTEPVTFIQQVLQAVPACFDNVTWLATHPYNDNNDPFAPGSLGSKHAQLSALVGGKPVAVTEGGASSYGGAVNVMYQAGHYSQLLEGLEAEACPLICTYNWQDEDQSTKDGCMGIRNPDGSEKPAAQIVRRHLNLRTNE